MSRWGPLAGKGGNKLESQKYFQTGCIQKIFEEVEPKIFSTRLRSNEATDCHYQGVLGSFSQATWRCPVFRWRSRMEDILTLSSMVIKVLTWTAKTSFFHNPYFRFLTLELTSALHLTTRPPLAPRSPCTSPSPKVGKSFYCWWVDAIHNNLQNLQGHRRKFIAFVSICKRTTCRAPTSPKLVPGSRFTSRTSVSEIQWGGSAAICAHHRVGHLGFLSCFCPCSSC